MTSPALTTCLPPVASPPAPARGSVISTARSVGSTPVREPRHRPVRRRAPLPPRLRFIIVLLLSGPPLLAPAAAWAEAHAQAGATQSPLLVVGLLAALSLLPLVLVTMTSFVKMAVVFSILRSAIGTPQIPPTLVITGLALLLSLQVMAPVGDRMASAAGPAWSLAAASQSWSSPSALAQAVAVGKQAIEPLRDFLWRNASPHDRRLFLDLARRTRAPEERTRVSERDFSVLAPAFVTSELKRAFQIGFLIYLPFLVIDLVVASILLSLGMQMLSPTSVSLPFKLLLFVLVDGWVVLARGLVLGYR
jgi:type III secretion protein R